MNIIINFWRVSLAEERRLELKCSMTELNTCTPKFGCMLKFSCRFALIFDLFDLKVEYSVLCFSIYSVHWTQLGKKTEKGKGISPWSKNGRAYPSLGQVYTNRPFSRFQIPFKNLTIWQTPQFLPFKIWTSPQIRLSVPTAMSTWVHQNVVYSC